MKEWLKKFDINLFLLGLSLIIAGAYVLINLNSFEESLDNLIFGLIALVIGLIIMWRMFLRKKK